jgi:hypothetical protein
MTAITTSYNTYYREPVKEDSLVKNRNKGLNEEITIQVDYQTPIRNNQMLELGAKNITTKRKQ